MEDQAAGPIAPSMSVRASAATAAAAPRARATGSLPAAAVGFTGAALASVVIARAAGAAAVPAPAIACLIAATAFTLLVGRRREPVPAAAFAWACLLSAGAAASLFLVTTRALPERTYGDGPMFARLVAEGQVVPRWLIGSAAASVVHAAIWELPPVRSRLPDAVQTPTAFLGVAGIVAMLAGTWGLVRRWPGQLAVLLPAMTPIWLLFGSGYVEYYPLVAAAFVAALAWLFERPLETRTALEMATLAACLPLLYVGFMPAAVLAFGAWAVVRPAEVPRTILLTLGIATLVIVACWPAGIVSYFRTLYAVLDFGDANLPPRYAGLVAGPASFMFAFEAVTSWAHARDVFYLLAWGGGWWTLPMLSLAASRAWSVAAPRHADVVRDARVWLGVALVAWQLYYLVFMLPRLGVRDDIDLFFSTYLTLAFMTGLLLDRTQTRHSPAWAAGTMACALAALACAAPWLVWIGLPPAP